jgi:hypothetical protein
MGIGPGYRDPWDGDYDYAFERRQQRDEERREAEWEPPPEPFRSEPLTPLEILQLAAAERRQVEIVVTECLYACCSQPVRLRSGYEQTYRGAINLDGNRLTLHATAIGTLNYHLIADLAAVQDARLVD